MDFFSSIGIIFKFLTVFYLFLTIVPILTPILNSVFFACLIKIILISLIYYYIFFPFQIVVPLTFLIPGVVTRWCSMKKVFFKILQNSRENTGKSQSLF